MSERVNVAILGASGYTGAELVRLLARHPRVTLAALTANRKAGQAFASVFPHLGGLDLPVLSTIEAVDWSAIDFVFCALPHGTTQTIIGDLLNGPHGGRLRIADLSADFRLADPMVYQTWYGHAHEAVELQKEAVYGLTEINRAAIATARLVAVPGCYPTSAQLPLIPLLRAGLIDPDAIIIDAKSGASGAGRDAKEGSLHCEVSEGIHAYGVGTHRHGPEIEQGLSLAVGRPVAVTFTPHLMPMNRGILSTIYLRATAGNDATTLRQALSAAYADEAFVRVVPEGVSPHTRHVRGSNFVLIGVHADRVPGRVIVTCVEDNLVKGASGQAIQDMNVMLGFPETLGLDQQPLFP
ncbi:N-acetyl-gamma-glutamyl-phosphate reductase [Rhodospirillum rubrum]|uniref:N-acetyl-gamma-glutamyl-phosphate reductase n=1 Tax=Rhodospirillum rubrum (strain ATCC 11170 / ATH 1.1.1 / DSM 467 / LMG 4362 / NCIMB 8255 / S1) TaxID=269796 RepID=ARGC_RHORT|nr:N-acetyl-gamma-glutamyl-phosphate reductase [Rhodospirillum rubrum]Q2RRM4.1 RecName: Full=N-acetyl-gamma-glutamyl-phosphate reductase; Short=AGPR; AltName: Full=N-acetyl-glutamate semialdehyde dehydrogenase; Short=NAGSA dehydrogenase [Rhodospirillum rubrum ATCC 11170]ABC23221.1 N-acetyl-gamma-glutamyl-phosphate reductase [Rhodospirillum rubrum ATCC 11170]AEO48952.1 N-acetyl-gamma-glutamyl-phosphate reductase [Rhodospirillum rubrum F11]MBK5954855.1 N-acetyl-gamma-glutamyl-phosphate reductase 